MAQIVDEFDNIGRFLAGVTGETNTLIGNGGNDTLLGAELVDVFYGGAGQDEITGGSGADRVVFQHDFTNTQFFGADRWVDFNASQIDKVDVSDLGQGLGTGGSIGIGEFDTLRAVWANVFYPGGSDVEITWGSSKLTLVGPLTSDLGTSHFVLNLVSSDDVLLLGSGNQIIALSLGHDFVDGEAGADTLFGEQGNDTVLGGLGNDSVFGGSGNDTVWGDEGIDTVNGGAGNDLLVGALGNDLIIGGLGADRASVWHDALTSTGGGTDYWVDFSASQGDRINVSDLGGQNTSTLDFGVGEFDTILAMQGLAPSGGKALVWGNTRMNTDHFGAFTASMFVFNTNALGQLANFSTISNIAAMGLGNDSMNGNDGNDTLFGEQGNDNLTGGNGADRLYGGSGNDAVEGNLGTDFIYGGAGRDVLTGATVFDAGQFLNHDQLYGGADDDTYLLTLTYTNAAKTQTSTASVVNESVNGGIDTIRLNTSLMTVGMEDEFEMAANVENLTAFGNQSLVMWANSLSNVIIAQNDTFLVVHGLAGNDTIYGANKGDLLLGETGDDMLYGGNGNNDWLVGGHGIDFMDGGAGNDVFFHRDTGLDSMTGGAGSRDSAVFADTKAAVQVTLNGSAYGNVVSGGNVIAKLRDIEEIRGSDFGDRITGDGNANFLSGGKGNDTLTGGGGVDHFMFRYTGSAHADKVTDFNTSQDRIILHEGAFSAIGASLTASEFHLGTRAADAGDRVIYNAATGDLYYDRDGSGAAAQVWIAEFQTRPVLGVVNFVIDDYEI